MVDHSVRKPQIKKISIPQIREAPLKKNKEITYNTIESGWGDLNPRPLRPERSALTGLRYTPKKVYKKSSNIKTINITESPPSRSAIGTR